MDVFYDICEYLTIREKVELTCLNHTFHDFIKQRVGLRIKWFNKEGRLFDKSVLRNYRITSLMIMVSIDGLVILDDGLVDSDMVYLKNMELLFLKQNDSITDEGLKYLTNVKSLLLPNNKKITDKGLEYLNCSKMRSVNLSSNDNITEYGMSLLKDAIVVKTSKFSHKNF